MNHMQKLALAAAGILCFVTPTLFAQIIGPFPDETWTIDENGPALLNNAPLVGYSIGHYQIDPISGITGWYYQLGGTNINVAGDVLLLEPDAPAGTISDLLRFDGNGVYFFSELEPNDTNPDKADVPVIPQPINPVVLTEVGSEGNNGVLYVPGAGQPGYDLSGVLPGIRYDIVSDVPEPASTTVLLAGAGLCLLSAARRKRN